MRRPVNPSRTYRPKRTLSSRSALLLFAVRDLLFACGLQHEGPYTAAKFLSLFPALTPAHLCNLLQRLPLMNRHMIGLIALDDVLRLVP